MSYFEELSAVDDAALYHEMNSFDYDGFGDQAGNVDHQSGTNANATLGGHPHQTHPDHHGHNEPITDMFDLLNVAAEDTNAETVAASPPIIGAGYSGDGYGNFYQGGVHGHHLHGHQNQQQQPQQQQHYMQMPVHGYPAGSGHQPLDQHNMYQQEVPLADDFNLDYNKPFPVPLPPGNRAGGQTIGSKNVHTVVDDEYKMDGNMPPPATITVKRTVGRPPKDKNAAAAPKKAAGRPKKAGAASSPSAAIAAGAAAASAFGAAAASAEGTPVKNPVKNPVGRPRKGTKADPVIGPDGKPVAKPKRRQKLTPEERAERKQQRLVQRRLRKSAREKERRTMENDYFVELGNLVGLPPDQRDKATILEKVIAAIREECGDDLTEEQMQENLKSLYEMFGTTKPTGAGAKEKEKNVDGDDDDEDDDDDDDDDQPDEEEDDVFDIGDMTLSKKRQAKSVKDKPVSDAAPVASVESK